MTGRLLPNVDAATDQQLRAALRTLARDSGAPEFRELVDGVLAGRRDVRDALDAPAVRGHVAAGLARMREQWEQLTPAERAELAAQTARR